MSADKDHKGVYYADYLGLDKILHAQHPESEQQGQLAHDEMLFIIVHQAYELWFKQILFEVGSVNRIMAQREINDNSPDLPIVVHRLKRVKTILEVLVQQVGIIESMTPLDFLDFRDLLRPASGFQSFQFKMTEAALGLRMGDRHRREYYLSMLRDEHRKLIEDMEKEPTLVDLVNDWLLRMPYFAAAELWGSYESGPEDPPSGVHEFWSDYRKAYADSLLESELTNLDHFDALFFEEENRAPRRFTARSSRNALFIMLYRDYPVMQLPYQFLTSLLDMDELMGTWRYRHLNMVHRMIGKRVGTGGSSGKDYLKSALDKHYIFTEVAELTTYLIDRKSLPQLPRELHNRLGFEAH